MIAHVIALAIRMHIVYPAAPLRLVAVTSVAAVLAETELAPAELLAAIAAHESSLEPRAVSWRRRDGRRIDRVVGNSVDDVGQIPSTGRLACGLVSSIASTRDGCAKLLDATEAMRAGAAELGEHRRGRACRGSLRCALASYSGGNKGIAAWRAGRRTDATTFAGLFIRRALALGMEAS